MKTKKLIIGLGGSGVQVARNFSGREQKLDNPAVTMLIDTDSRDLVQDGTANTISLSNRMRLGEALSTSSIRELGDWLAIFMENYSDEYVKSIEMDKGAGLWRAKAVLSLYIYLSDDTNKKAFHSVLDKVTEGFVVGDKIELDVVTSLCGGTGSALFVPVTMYVKNYLRQKTGAKVDAKAYLLCPDIYELKLTQEQMVKANANAYASLRELNAVNLTALSGTQDGEYLPINFAYGDDENQSFGVLFDAKRQEFRQPNTLPFEKIYLFERFTGIQSISVHEGMVADLLELSYREENAFKEVVTKKKEEAIFGSLALTKIHYPKESVVKYIARKSAVDLVREWVGLYNETDKRMYDHKISQLSIGLHAKPDQELFPVFLRERASEILENAKQDGNALLGKEGKTEINLALAVDKAGVVNQAKESLTFGGLDSIKSVIESKGYLFGEQKHQKDKYKDEFTAFREGIFSEINAEREKNLAKIEEIKKNATADSLIQEALKLEGAYVNPVFQLVRLVELKEILKSKSKYDLTENKIDDAWLNNASYETRTKKTEDKKTKEEKKAEKIRAKFRKKHADVSDFIDDVENACENLKNSLIDKYVQIFESQVDELIESYRLFMKSLSSAMSDVEISANLALLENSTSTETHVHVYAREGDKIKAYESFSALVKSGEQKIFDEGEVFESVTKHISGVETDENRDLIDEILQELEEKGIEQIEKSDFYKAHFDRNIIDVLVSPDPMVVENASVGARDVVIRRALKTVRPALKCSIPEEAEDREAIKEATCVVFPVTNGANDSEKAQEILVVAGEGECDAVFGVGYDTDTLLVLRKLENVRLCHFILTDEDQADSVGYVSAEKAVNMMKKHFTPLWNPFICPMDRGLPFINPVLNKKKEQRIARALLYALAKEKIALMKDEDGKKAYFYESRDGMTKIKYDGDAVKDGELNKLVLWLKDSEVLSHWSQAYLYQTEKERADLPVVETQEGGVSTLKRAINSLYLYGKIKEILFKTAFDLRENFAFGYYADLILTVGRDTVEKTCLQRMKEKTSGYDQLYSGELKDLIDRFTASILKKDIKTARVFSDYVREREYFTTYGEDGEKINVEFNL